MPIISLAVPNELLKKIDEYVRHRGYYSRSEVFRDAVRNLIEETEYLSKEKISATIMVTYDKDNTSLSRIMGKLNHDFNDIVVESIHRHLGGNFCIDIFITEGDKQRVMELLSKIRGLHGVYHVKHMFIPFE